jgi:hypothetical protein
VAPAATSEITMHKARAFLFVCAGIILLALTHHLSARAAHGQGGRQLVHLTQMTVNGCLSYVAVDASGTLYAACGTIPPGTTWQVVGQLPGTPVDLNAFGTNRALAAMANGDIYEARSDLGPGFQITFSSNVFGGPTPATQPTWGQLKSRYRQPAPTTPQDK